MKKTRLTSYVVLLIMLLFCAGGLILLGSDLFAYKETSMKDLTQMSKKELFTWVNENDLSNYVNYEYEYSDTIDNGYVIDQSLDANDTIKTNFDVFISKGNIVELANEGFKTKEDFENFINKFNNVSVTYTEEPDATKNDGDIIRYSKETIDLKNDDLEVTVANNSIDDSKKEEDKVLDNTEDKKKEEAKDNNKDTKLDEDLVLIPNNLLGISEESFIKKLNDLGFENLKKNQNKFYSFTSKKDTIFSYDDGNFDTSRVINYAISLGSYVSAFNASEYNGKTINDANTLVKKYNAQNAHITLKTVDKVTNDTNSVGKLEGCACEKSGTNSIITCNLLTKTVVSNEKVIPNYVGKTEEEFKNSLKNLGFNNLNKGSSKYSSQPYNTVISHDQGTKKLTDTINYVLSLGAYSFNANEYNGKTLDAAKQVANSYNAQGANIQINNPQKVENSNVTNDTLFDCTASTGSGPTIITCKLAYTVPSYEFLQKSFIIDKCVMSSSFENSVNILQELYEGKFNIQYLKTSASEKYSNQIMDKNPGQVIEVTVNGYNDYASGLYRADSKILIYIVDKTTQ